MSVEWTRDLALEHEELDHEHALLFARLDAVSALLDTGAPAEIERAVAALADALVSHLAAEEALMEEAHYPERGRHKSAHELFVADFLRMRAELREEGPTPFVASWLRIRIPEWLRFHIRVNDAPLAAHLARPHPGPQPRPQSEDLRPRKRRRDGRRPA